MTDFRAISLVLTAMFCFALQDVIVKFIADQVSIWQMLSIRSFAILPLLGLPLWLMGRRAEVFPVRWRWPLVRACFMTLAYLFFYASLPYISLAKAASTFFISPMLITLFAAIFLGEPIGPRRIAAVVVGFAGVLLIVQPGLDGWTPVALLPVAAAICYALGVILTRWRCQLDPGFSLTMVNAMVNLAVGSAGLLILPALVLAPDMRAEHGFLTEGWQPVALGVITLVGLTAVTHVAGALSSTKAYQIGQASRLAPFEYTYLALMTVWGYVIWRDVPDQATLIGMAFICASGIFVAWREGRPPRPRMNQTAEVPWTPAHDRSEPQRLAGTPTSNP